MAVHSVSHVSAPPVQHNSPPPKPAHTAAVKPAHTAATNQNAGSTGKTVNKTA